VQSRTYVPLMAGLLVIGRLAVLNAQEPTVAPPVTDSAAATRDTGVQGYAPAPAASATAAAAPAAAKTVGATLGFIDVLPARSSERIKAELEAAKSDEREAKIEREHGEQQREHTKAMAEVKKQEISTIDARKKVAEKTKNEAEKIALEAEKKDAERQKQFLERRAALHAAEIDRAKAAMNVAESNQRALEMELQLNSRRLNRPEGAASARHDVVIRELEAKVLEAQRDQASAEKQLADKDLDIARRRLELHRAQIAVGGS